MPYYAGLDLARYRDFTALVLGKLEKGEGAAWLSVTALKTWPHVDYSIIEQDLRAIAAKFVISKIGVDATNEVSFAERLPSLGLRVEPLKFTAALKHEMVPDVVLFMSQRKIVIPRKAQELLTQIREQERVISQAGTIRYAHPEGRPGPLR